MQYKNRIMNYMGKTLVYECVITMVHMNVHRRLHVHVYRLCFPVNLVGCNASCLGFDSPS